ncbi:MAG: ATP-binding protein [Thermoplasmata archaeon]|nr:ATP-binding protein [Thermoplasmata archaeon]
MDGAFLGREEELRHMEEVYEKKSFQFIAVKGRRRVGKTTLIQKFMENKKGVYFSARGISTEDNIRMLSAKLFGDEQATENIDVLLKGIFEMSKNERFVLAIDEYPRLCRKDNDVSDAFQQYIDENKNSSKLYLILSGSSMSMVEHEIIGESSPLYGRYTEQIDVTPFSYFEAREFLPHYTEDEKMRIFDMVGGMPGYLIRFQEYDNLIDPLVKEFLRRDAYFRNESRNILLQEFVKPDSYHQVLTAIANGYTTLGAIASKARMTPSLADRYVGHLISLKFIERLTPVDNPNGKTTRYRISDPYLMFFHRHILPTAGDSDDERLRAEANRILESQTSELGYTFETVSMQYLGKIWGGDAGTWWGDDSLTKTTREIDVVMTRETENGFEEGLFVECKYKNEKIGIDVLDRLIYNSELVRRYQRKSYAICSKSGFTENLEKKEGVLLLTLEDMVDGWSGKDTRRPGIRSRSTRC